jgi:hypothetical protein
MVKPAFQKTNFMLEKFIYEREIDSIVDAAIDKHYSDPGGEDDDETEFTPCSMCDGHPACEDFGCAYELGVGHLVEKEPGNDFE